MRIYFILIIFFLTCCTPHISTDGDVWAGYQAKNEWVNADNIDQLQICQSHYSQVVGIFGQNFYARYSFPDVLYKEFEDGCVTPVDRIIVYFDTISNIQQLPGVRVQENVESLSVAFFFHSDVLVQHSISHQRNVPDQIPWETMENTTENVLDTANERGEISLWPHAGCDIKYYDKYVLENEILGNLEGDCIWEDEKNYEEFIETAPRCGCE